MAISTICNYSGVHKAIRNCGGNFYQVNEQKLFPAMASDGSLCFTSISYLVKSVPEQDGPEVGSMPLDPPITRLKGKTVCAVIFNGNDTYETATEKLESAMKLLEAA